MRIVPDIVAAELVRIVIDEIAVAVLTPVVTNCRLVVGPLAWLFPILKEEDVLAYSGIDHITLALFPEELR